MGLLAKLQQARRLVRLLADMHRGVKDLPEIHSVDQLVSQHMPGSGTAAVTRTLDIGCGPDPKNPFRAVEIHGLDIREDLDRNIRYADLTIGGTPYPDDHFEFVTAFEFLEHVPRVIYLPERRFAFVELMNEVWRITKPGGLFLSSTPIYPFSPAFRDPTHVNLMTHETMSIYFDSRHRGAAMYGFRGAFDIVAQGRLGSNLVCIMRKLVRPQLT